MARPRNKFPDGLEPVTEALVRLTLWLEGPPRRITTKLARACGYTQQRISLLLCRRTRLDPDSELAHLLAIATGGAVPPETWLVPAEAQARAERRRAAAAYALTIVDPPLEARQVGRRPGQKKENAIGQQLGLALGAARPGIETGPTGPEKVPAPKAERRPCPARGRRGALRGAAAVGDGRTS
jgi:hypothetical protein